MLFLVQHWSFRDCLVAFEFEKVSCLLWLYAAFLLFFFHEELSHHNKPWSSLGFQLIETLNISFALSAANYVLNHVISPFWDRYINCSSDQMDIVNEEITVVVIDFLYKPMYDLSSLISSIE